MVVDGKWWLIRYDEGFDRDHNLWFELRDGAVSDQTGECGTYSVTGQALTLALAGEWGQTLVFSTEKLGAPEGSPTVPITADTDSLNGFVDDDYSCLWRDGDWTESLTAKNRELGNRYSTIDVSMYDPLSSEVRAIGEASGVAEIEAALAKLPLAKVSHG